MAITIDMTNGDVTDLEIISTERRSPQPENVDHRDRIPELQPELAIHTFETVPETGMPEELARANPDTFLDEMEGLDSSH